ncbi:TolC family protein [Parasediminibacterium sp. JCM 36343]|uniref:TolC family protein n=1 Tax=Parasediminibacterium sp. JCM 36343 TaxID=3374279 RepID=UPI0039781659
MVKRLMLLIFVGMAVNGLCQPFFRLQDAINTALKNNFDIRVAQNNIDIAHINNYKGIVGALPTVAGSLADNEQVQSINQTYTDASKDVKRDNVGSNTLTAGITGSILLFNGMRVHATEKRLALLEQQGRQQLNLQIQTLIASITTQYYTIVMQQGLLKTILKSIDASVEKLSILQSRKQVGLANDADIFQAQSDLNDLKQQQKSQELAISQAKIILLTLITIPTDTNITIRDTIIVDTTIVLDSIKNRLANNPQIVAAAQQVAINRQIEKETAALRYPTVKANAGYLFSNNKSAAGFSLLNQSYGPFVGVSLGIPIYNGSIYKRQQQVAAINTENAALQKNSLLFNAYANATSYYETYTVSLQQLKTGKENYALSGKLLDLVLQKFRLGQSTIIDLKLAQQSFENAGYQLVSLSYNAKAAEIALKQLASNLKF